MVRLLWIALSSLGVVAAAGALVLYLHGRGVAPSPAPPPPPALSDEAHYYVLLALVEVEPGNGEARWDGAGGPPDLFYRVRWQRQEVFRSATKEDTLVARWSNVSVGLGDVMGAVSLDDSIKAARITARKGGTVEFLVFDDDLVFEDPVGSWAVPVEELRVGDQVWTRPGGRVVTAHCRVLPIEGVPFEALTR